MSLYKLPQTIILLLLLPLVTVESMLPIVQLFIVIGILISCLTALNDLCAQGHQCLLEMCQIAVLFYNLFKGQKFHRTGHL